MTRGEIKPSVSNPGWIRPWIILQPQNPKTTLCLRAPEWSAAAGQREDISSLWPCVCVCVRGWRETLVPVCFPFPLNQKKLWSNLTPPCFLYHPQHQLIRAPDRCHMHLWFILVRVCARTYVYIHLSEVEEMFPARVTITTLTPDWGSDYQIAKCFPHGSQSLQISLADVLVWPQSSHSHPTANTAWPIAHKRMTSCLLMLLRLISLRPGTGTGQPVCCLFQLGYKLGCLEKNPDIFRFIDLGRE